jgi:hypothetical protein
MSRDIAISLLRQGSTAEEILQILETIVSGNDGGEFDAAAGEPTPNAIEF